MKQTRSNLLWGLPLHRAAGGGAAKPAFDSTGEAARQPDKKAVLVVSFGTSYNQTRAATIDAIEAAIANAFTGFEVRRAFTSQMIINKLKSRDKLHIDNVEQALQRLAADGVKTLAVQPTHVMNGFEYDDMVETVRAFAPQFDALSIGAPLLSGAADYTAVADCLLAQTAGYNTEKTAVLLMGHGTGHPANAAYRRLDALFKARENAKNYYVGTVEAEPALPDILAQLAKTDAARVVLLPLMIVAGDHAVNDMAGDEPDSWKSQLQSAGYEVSCILRGLGEYADIQSLFVAHAQDAVDALGR